MGSSERVGKKSEATSQLTFITMTVMAAHRVASPKGGFSWSILCGNISLYSFFKRWNPRKRGVLMSQEKGSTYIRTHTHTAHYYWSWGAGKIAVRFMASFWISYTCLLSVPMGLPSPCTCYLETVPTFLPKQYKGYGSRKFLKEFTALL